MKTIHMDHVLNRRDDAVALVIDQEGAEYIAAVMRAEFERTADGGALGIAQKIEGALR
ncbi:hypothetical protein UQW22_10045 [Isoptericola halotolerans]|uniref:hypothetical protein n=1 Tax=Isoptericola halotolerans TaxID=300560 RepID=UPI00388FC8E8